MKGLEEFLANLLEHVRTGDLTVALLVVLAVLYGPLLWHVFWRSAVLRKIEAAYLQRIQHLEGVAERGQVVAQERITLLENLIKERDDLLRKREDAVLKLLETSGAQESPSLEPGIRPNTPTV